MTSPSFYSVVPSGVGPLTLRWSNGALVGLYFENAKPLAERDAWVRDDERLSPVRTQLEEYFRGERTTFDVPLVFEGGTPFQQRLWRALLEIPFGETTTYGELAQKLGETTWPGARAVGAAAGANPIAVIVPCHRVVGAGGALVGFGGGLPRKRWLLAHEGADLTRTPAEQLSLF